MTSPFESSQNQTLTKKSPLSQGRYRTQEMMIPSKPPAKSEREFKVENRFEAGESTIASDRHPESNEDTALKNPEKGIFAVADGVSTSKEGALGSAFVIKELDKALSNIDSGLTPDEIKLFIENELLRVNKASAVELNKQGSTTLSIVKVIADRAYIAQVGDSRIYRFNKKDNQLETLTVDDGQYLKGMAQMMVDQEIEAITDPVEKENLQKNLEGKILEKAKNLQDKLDEFNPNTWPKTDPEYIGLSAIYQNRNIISQAMGSGQDIKPVVTEIKIADGDVFVVTSDGIHDNLTKAEMTQIVKEAQTPQQAAEALTKAAHERANDGTSRSKPDDITAVVFEQATTEKATRKRQIDEAERIQKIKSELKETINSEYIKSQAQFLGNTLSGKFKNQFITDIDGFKKYFNQVDSYLKSSEAQDYGNAKTVYNSLELLGKKIKTLLPPVLRDQLEELQFTSLEHYKATQPAEPQFKEQLKKRGPISSEGQRSQYPQEIAKPPAKSGFLNKLKSWWNRAGQ